MNISVNTAGRILDMLEMFAATSANMDSNRVAEKLRMHEGDAQSLLATLAARGYLARVGGEFALPKALRSGGWADSTRARLQLLAAPILKELVKQIGESAFLSVLAGDEVQYLAKELSGNEVRYDASLAHKRPAYCTASGIIQLAYRSSKEVQAMLARVELLPVTRHTITDPAAILRWIRRSRRAGYAVTHEGYMLGGSGLAAPVFGATGEVVAALAIGGATTRFKKDQKRLARMVVAQAAALSRSFSGRAPGGQR